MWPGSDSLLSRPVTLSVLDRLKQDNPMEGSEWPTTQLDFERRLERSVRENLEWLLNTRRIAEPVLEHFKNVRESAHFFGLPDLTRIAVESLRDRQKLCTEIESAIRLFERRLDQVRIVLLDSVYPTGQKLSFRIEGKLLIEPLPKPIFYYTVLDLTTQNCEIKEQE